MRIRLPRWLLAGPLRLGPEPEVDPHDAPPAGSAAGSTAAAAARSAADRARSTAAAPAGSTASDRPPAPPPAPPPPTLPIAPIVVPRWIQAVVLPLALLLLWELLQAAGSVLFVFVFACVIALILNPLAKTFERVMPRGASIVAVYVAVFAVLTAVGILVSNPIGNQIDHFSNNVPHLVREANRELTSAQRFLKRNNIPIQIQQQGQSALTTLEKDVKKSSGSIVSFSRDLLGQLVTLSVEIVLTFVMSVYLLVYARQIGTLARRIMPPGDGTHEDDYPLQIQKAVSGYIRGQILFSVVMGTSAGVVLWLFGVIGLFPDGSKYTVFFAIFYGIAEFVPYIGPIVGPVPAVLVALFTSPVSAVWVVILFIGLQQLEGHIVAPQVFRISLRINPILVILSLLVGYQIYGVAGALLALPLATITRQTIVYLRGHLVLEPWARAVPDAFGSGGMPPGPSPPLGPGPSPPLGFDPDDEVTAYRESR